MIQLSVDESPTFRRPKTILPVPTPSPQFQHVEAGVPDTQLTREATGLLREFSTPLLFNHSHRVFFWANEMGRQTGQKFDVELVFICAAFHDLGLLKKFSSATDRFEVDSANAVRQFLEHHGVPNARIQTAWDAISLHTTPRHCSVQAFGSGTSIQRRRAGCARHRLRRVSRRPSHENRRPVSAGQFQAGYRRGIPSRLRTQDPNDGRYLQRRHLLAFHPQLQAEQLLRPDSEFTIPKLLSVFEKGTLAAARAVHGSGATSSPLL